jgi:hypothetical protein
MIKTSNRYAQASTSSDLKPERANCPKSRTAVRRSLMERAASYAGMKALILGSGSRANGAMIANAAMVANIRHIETVFSLRLGGASMSTICFGWMGWGIIRFPRHLSSFRWQEP